MFLPADLLELAAYTLTVGVPMAATGYGLARLRESGSRHRELCRLHRRHTREHKRRHNSWLLVMDRQRATHEAELERLEAQHQRELDAACNHAFDAGRRSILDRPEPNLLTPGSAEDVAFLALTAAH